MAGSGLLGPDLAKTLPSRRQWVRSGGRQQWGTVSDGGRPCSTARYGQRWRRRADGDVQSGEARPAAGALLRRDWHRQCSGSTPQAADLASPTAAAAMAVGGGAGGRWKAAARALVRGSRGGTGCFGTVCGNRGPMFQQYIASEGCPSALIRSFTSDGAKRTQRTGSAHHKKNSAHIFPSTPLRSRSRPCRRVARQVGQGRPLLPSPPHGHSSRLPDEAPSIAVLFLVPDPASASSLVREPPLRSGVEVTVRIDENDSHDSFEVNLSWKN
ncbi:hypothetical protein OsJ_31799 [Oryza sativa Japonica Group]|uniref:Uncharacterized protein n=1 Tax=Oryza sativa subsp. japonica TaxID=39947 RepID=B9G646_ORYSJ|nr:hypothetical protein OsJ_31799 [Oryza sativa Japonica Group]